MTTIQSERAGGSRAPGLWNRQLTAYPHPKARRLYLVLVVLITVMMYYQLFTGAAVAPMLLPALKIPFKIYVYLQVIGSVAGAIAALTASLTDRFGRVKLVIGGQLLSALIVLFGLPSATGLISYGIAVTAVAFVEGLVLIATPALVRDFSPQMARGTAMGFWTLGPVLGSWMTTVVMSITLPHFHTWQSQFQIAGGFGLVVFVLALLFLRELAPSLRNQRMVHERDRILLELKSKGMDLTTGHSWRQLMHVDVFASAVGVTLYLFFYLTMTMFGMIYVTTAFHYDMHQASVLLNWGWGVDAVALITGGMLSDRLRVRKPLMLVGAVVCCILLWVMIQTLNPGAQPPYAMVTALMSCLLFFTGIGYVTWMASFTETIEEYNPALMATGLAVWGWVSRVITIMLVLCLPLVVTTVDTLIGARPILEAYKKVQADHTAPSAELMVALERIKHATEIAPGQWQTWFWICMGGTIFFIVTVFFMRGRWSPAAAKRDLEAHHTRIAEELATLHASSSAQART